VRLMIDLEENHDVADVFIYQPGRKLLIASTGGYGFIVKSEDLLTRVKAGKTFMTLEEGEEVIRPAPVPEKPELAAAFSEDARMLLFAAGELKEMGRGRGITLMGLKDKETLVAVGFGNSKSVSVEGISRSGNEKTVKIEGADLQKYIVKRARRGCLLPGKLKPTGVAKDEG